GSLARPPLTTSLKAGCVVLSPGQAVPLHFTGEGDEALIVLEGTATVFLGQTPNDVPTGCAAFIPPRTSHSVANRTTKNVKYVYVAALK
ncbi:MAG: cupin domain-containing protein, partial [Candidatus Micrarchaeota archaeon]